MSETISDPFSDPLVLTCHLVTSKISRRLISVCLCWQTYGWKFALVAEQILDTLSPPAHGEDPKLIPHSSPTNDLSNRIYQTFGSPHLLVSKRIGL